MAHQQAVPAPNHRWSAGQSQPSYHDGVVRIVSEFGKSIFLKKLKKFQKKLLTSQKTCGIIVKLSARSGQGTVIEN